MIGRDFIEAPPTGAVLTDYDRAQLKTYLRLLDAAAEGADWREAAAAIFGLDVAADPERARQIYRRHLERARWMTEHGYRDLLRRD